MKDLTKIVLIIFLFNIIIPSTYFEARAESIGFKWIPEDAAMESKIDNYENTICLEWDFKDSGTYDLEYYLSDETKTKIIIDKDVDGKVNVKYQVYNSADTNIVDKIVDEEEKAISKVDGKDFVTGENSFAWKAKDSSRTEYISIE